MPTSNDFIKTCKECRAFCCTAHRPPVNEKEKNAIINAGYADFFVKVKKGIFELISKDRRCPYLLDDFSCEIQEVKPSLCKAWPVIPRCKGNIREFFITKCPLFYHLSEEDIKKAKDEAKKIPKDIVDQLWTLSEEIRKDFKKFDYEKL